MIPDVYRLTVGEVNSSRGALYNGTIGFLSTLLINIFICIYTYIFFYVFYYDHLRGRTY